MAVKGAAMPDKIKNQPPQVLQCIEVTSTFHVRDVPQFKAIFTLKRDWSF